jgi:hypothetical protein
VTSSQSAFLVVRDRSGRLNLRLPLPTNLSAIAFMLGARTAILITFVPAPFATWSNAEPNLSSRSRRRKRGASPSMVAFRSCCAVHSCVGFRVAATWTTRLDARWTMKNAYTWRKKMS